ncbi:chaperone NapD [Parasalinivibrio latis]|uniref:chaperone NapD n=1 Tax=Parasalinivibrio latis TaxID=2952610 RepID=UPI0030E2E9B9
MSEYHVSSLVVHAAADQQSTVREAITAIEGAEVPASSEAGKLVVVVEGDTRGTLLDKFEAIRALPGVLAATLVYHQIDNEEEPALAGEGVEQ